MKKYQIVGKYSLSSYIYEASNNEVLNKQVADSKEEAIEKAKALINSDHSEYYVIEILAKVCPEKRDFNITVEEIN